MANEKTNNASALDVFSPNRLFQMNYSARMTYAEPYTDEFYLSTAYRDMEQLENAFADIVRDTICDDLDPFCSSQDTDPCAIDYMYENSDSFDELHANDMKDNHIGCRRKDIRKFVMGQMHTTIQKLSEMDKLTFTDGYISQQAESLLIICNDFINAAEEANDIIIQSLFDLGYSYYKCLIGLKRKTGKYVDEFARAAAINQYTVAQIADFAVGCIDEYAARWYSIPSIYESDFGKDRAKRLRTAVSTALDKYAQMLDWGDCAKPNHHLAAMVLGWARIICTIPGYTGISLCNLMDASSTLTDTSWKQIYDICSLAIKAEDASDNEISSMTANLASILLANITTSMIPTRFIHADRDCGIEPTVSIDNLDKIVYSPFLPKCFTRAKDDMYYKVGVAYSEFSLHVFDQSLFMDMINIFLAKTAVPPTEGEDLTERTVSPFADRVYAPDDTASEMYNLIKHALRPDEPEEGSKGQKTEADAKIFKSYRKFFKKALDHNKLPNSKE